MISPGFKRSVLVLGVLATLLAVGPRALRTYLAYEPGCAAECIRAGSCPKLEVSLQVAETRVRKGAAPLWYRVELKNPGCLKVPVDAGPFYNDETPFRAPFDSGFSLTLYDPNGRALAPRSTDADEVRLYQVDTARLSRLFQDGTLDRHGFVTLSDGAKLVTAPSELSPYRVQLQEVTELDSRGTMFVRVPVPTPRGSKAPPEGFRALEGYTLKPGHYNLVATYRARIHRWAEYPRLRRLPSALIKLLHLLDLAPEERLDEVLIEAPASRVDIEVRP